MLYNELALDRIDQTEGDTLREERVHSRAIASDSGLTLATHVRNDPVNLTDPLGLIPETIVIGSRRRQRPQPYVGVSAVGASAISFGDGGGTGDLAGGSGETVAIAAEQNRTPERRTRPPRSPQEEEARRRECAATMFFVVGSAAFLAREAPEAISIARSIARGASVGRVGGLGGIVIGAVVGGAVGTLYYIFNGQNSNDPVTQSLCR